MLNAPVEGLGKAETRVGSTCVLITPVGKFTGWST